MAIVVRGVKPKSIANTPKIIPNGTTGIISGLVSFIPLKKFFDLLLILQAFIKSKQYDQYVLVFLFQISHLPRVDECDENEQILVLECYLEF